MNNQSSTAITPRPIIVGVGGFTSEVGKTTLMCDLLKAFPGWEAIKTTLGHYRSCGKDPEACCVSHLLKDEPVIRSGRELTYEPGKDTGRYWDSGASNVHWLIATENQVEQGIKTALQGVSAAGVFVEGNSFAEFVSPDFFVMVARSGETKIKNSARKALDRVSAFYLSGEVRSSDRDDLVKIVTRFTTPDFKVNTPIFGEPELASLLDLLRKVDARIAA